MSDSVDRVFVHALATVRRLPRTGSSRPPPTARLQLYGLYKQSMEGDVSAILPRPTLPPPSPDATNPTNNSVHRYASRDLRAREAQAEIEKWDAWHACAGLSRTEAKRRYITTLIETMKEYASGTAESRELVSELEFVWNQIRSQSGSDESEEGESPTRKLERAGLKRMTTDQSNSRAGDNNRSRGQGSSSIFGRLDNSQGLRVLSPISQRSSDGVVENAELPQPDPDEDDDEEDYASASEDKLEDPKHPPPTPAHARPATSSGTPNEQWRHQIESHLRQLTTELAALREQLSSSHMLSRASFSIPTHLPLRRRIVYRISMWSRWLFWTTMRQLCIQLAMLLTLVIWGRIRGDRRVETWCRQRLKELTSWSRYVAARRGDREVGV